MKYFFIKNHADNEAGRPVSDLFWFFNKVLYKTKASGQHLRLYETAWD